MHIHKKALAGSIYLFLMSFLFERLWFYTEYLQLKNGVYIAARLVLLIIVIAAGQALHRFCVCLKNQDAYADFMLKIFLVYFIVMITILVFIWPGIWRWDELWVLEGSKYLKYNSYQHFLTSLFYICSFMFFPVPVGVVVLQILVVSVIIAYLITGVHRWIIADKKLAYFCLLPFFFFPVIDSNMYPLRCSVYAFVELLYLGMTVFESIRLKRQKETMVSNEFSIGYIITGVLLAVWRTEGFYYILIAPMLYIFAFFKKSRKVQKVFVSAAIIFLTMAGVHYQNKLLSNTIGDQNTVISTLNYIEVINSHEELREKEKHLLEKINQVVDLTVLEEYGAGAIWDDSSGLLKTGEYSRREYRQYFLAYMKLVFKHPRGFIKCQMPRYLQANGMLPGEQFVYHTENLYDAGDEIYDTDRVKESFKSYDLTKPCSISLRKGVIQVLEFIQPIFLRYPFKLLRIAGYNSIIPTILLFGIVLYEIIKRRWFLTVIFSIPLMKLPLLFATVPGSAFMYYYSIYLIGYCISVCIFAGYLQKKRTENGG